MTRSALDRWLTALQARRRWVLALATLVSLTALPGLARLESDNAPEVFFAADAVGRRTLQAFRQRYGSDRFVRVALSGPHLWRKQSLAALPRLSRRLSQVAGVTQVSGLHERDAALGRAWPPSDLEALRRQAVRDPLSRALGWVGAKGRVLTLLVHLKRQSAVGERATLVALRQVVHATLPAGLSGALSGLPVLSARLDDSAADIPRLYFPWLIVLATLLLWLRFRRLAAVAQALALVALTCVCTLGWMGYAEVRLNLVLVTLLPLLFSLSLATVVHVQVDVMRHRRQGHSAQHALAQSYRDKGWALLWAGLTTSAGFASLLSSNVAPIRMLGGWTALGLAWMTLLVFGLLPLLLASNTSLSQVPLPQGCAMRAAGPWACRRLERGLLRWRGAWLGWPLRYARSVVLGFALVALAAALALPHLHSRSDAVDYLPAADPVRRDIRALEAAGIGSASVEVDLRWPKAAPSAAESAPPAADSLDLDALAAAEDAPPTPSHPLLEPARYQALTRFVRALRRHPDVLQALAPTDVIAAAFRAHPEARLLPPAAGRGVAVQALGGFRRVPLRHLSTPSGAHTRVSVLVRTGDVAALADIERHIRTQAGRHLKAATLTLTGAYPLLLHTQQALLATLGSSLAWTALVVALAFLWLLRRWDLWWRGMLTNLWPVLLMLAGMQWLGIAIDVGTVMVAALTLGIAVDDTLHTLGHYRSLEARHGPAAAARLSLRRTAPAYLLNALVLAAGFGVCALSDFRPTARFGGVTALGVLLALLADLVLLPALLALAGDRRKVVSSQAAPARRSEGPGA